MRDWINKKRGFHILIFMCFVGLGYSELGERSLPIVGELLDFPEKPKFNGLDIRMKLVEYESTNSVRYGSVDGINYFFKMPKKSRDQLRFLDALLASALLNKIYPGAEQRFPILSLGVTSDGKLVSISQELKGFSQIFTLDRESQNPFKSDNSELLKDLATLRVAVFFLGLSDTHSRNIVFHPEKRFFGSIDLDFVFRERNNQYLNEERGNDFLLGGSQNLQKKTSLNYAAYYFEQNKNKELITKQQMLESINIILRFPFSQYENFLREYGNDIQKQYKRLMRTDLPDHLRIDKKIAFLKKRYESLKRIANLLEDKRPDDPVASKEVWLHYVFIVLPTLSLSFFIILVARYHRNRR